MALQITLSTIETPGHVLQVLPTLAGTSTLSIAVTGVKRQITLILAGS